MSYGAFTDKKHEPTEAEIQAALGSQLSTWQELIRFIRDNYPSDEDFRFLYGKQYGRALRFRIRGQLLTSLYPADEGFTVQINLSPAAVEQAQQMNLGENVQGAIARARPYPEERWLFIPVGRRMISGISDGCWRCVSKRRDFKRGIKLVAKPQRPFERGGFVSRRDGKNAKG
jgi:hypothetical protein